MLDNLGAAATTVGLSVGDLPTGVTATLSTGQVVLARGERRDPSGPGGVTVTVSQAQESSTVFRLLVVGTALEAPGVARSASAFVAVRPAAADVVGVDLAPSVVESGDTVAVSARVLNSANARRSIVARADLLDASGATVGEPLKVDVDLVASLDVATVPIGQLGTSGLPDGLYQVRVALLAADARPLPGRSGTAPLYVGAPVTAAVRSVPGVVPPGTSIVTTEIEVTGIPPAVMDGRAAASAAQAQAAAPIGPPVLGGQLFSTGAPVEVEIKPASASITSTLSLYEPPPILRIATNRDVGTIVQLGTFPVGVELVFGIAHGSSIFRMGPGERNADGVIHAVVTPLDNGGVLVGFEDLPGGGDGDYDDNIFEFRGGITPEPVPTLDIDLRHLLAPGYAADFGSITPPAESATVEDIRWTVRREVDEPATVVFRVVGQVTGMLPGEVREISRGSLVDVTATDTDGVQVLTSLSLPPVAVAAAHIIRLDPPSRTVAAGDATVFTVTLHNPLPQPVTYQLVTVGLEDLAVTLASSVDVPAGETVATTLAVDTSPSAAVRERTFGVVTRTEQGAVDSVEGSLAVVAGAPIAFHGVKVDVAPDEATAGQGASAVYRVRVTNTGDASDTFSLVASVPPGVAARFADTPLAVPAGVASGRETTLTLTPSAGTPAGRLPFDVTATSTTRSTLLDDDVATLVVSDRGVAVTLTPSQAVLDPNGTGSFRATITNTGTQADSFDVSLAGPLGPFGCFSITTGCPTTLRIALAPGESYATDIELTNLQRFLRLKTALLTVATSVTDPTISGAAAAIVEFGAARAVQAELFAVAPGAVCPGALAYALEITNTGNACDEAYEVTFVSDPPGATFSAEVTDFLVPPFHTAHLDVGVIIPDGGSYTLRAEVRARAAESGCGGASAMPAPTVIAETTATLIVCAPPSGCHAQGICDPATATCPEAPLPDGTPCAGTPSCDGTCQAGACVCPTTTTTTTSTPSTSTTLPDWECFAVKRRAFATRGPIEVSDAFGTHAVEIQRPEAFCAPAAVGPGPTAMTGLADHLVAYRMPSSGVVDPPQVTVVNEIEERVFGAFRLDRLLIPTAASLAGPPEATLATGNPFLCYRVRAKRPRFHRVRDVEVRGVFGAKDVQVLKPKRLCLPASDLSFGRDGQSGATSLLCYRVRPEEHAFFRERPIFIANEVQPAATLDAIHPNEICLPSHTSLSLR
ncbi:MAG: hypothetical protein KIT14_07005 [bacterium]|nr:hypothetical protein [bacterium]